MLVVLMFFLIVWVLKWLWFDVLCWGFGPAGLVIGGMTGTAGGAGVLFAPVLLSTGLTGAAYVGTSSTIAFATHAGRVVAYASNGVFTRDLAIPTIVVALAITAGNALGERVRKILSDRITTRLEYGVLVVCVGVSLAGAI